jgi:AbrB family looped-hinge helix DNA binding protein
VYTTTISTKYQVVIPREIRKQFNLKPGQKIAFVPFLKTLHVIVVPPIEEARGILAGLDLEGYREEQEEERP